MAWRSKAGDGLQPLLMPDSGWYSLMLRVLDPTKRSLHCAMVSARFDGSSLLTRRRRFHRIHCCWRQWRVLSESIPR